MGRCYSASRSNHVLFIVYALLAAVTRAMNSCFNTDDYNAVRGRPFTVTWPDDKSIYDLSLVSDQQKFIGFIARNITQTSLTWTPPLNITSGPYQFELKNWNRLSTCYSKNVTVSGSTNAQVTNLPGPLATSAVTINNQRTTVTATVAEFTPTLQVSATPIQTASSTSSPKPSSSSSTPKLQIGIGVAFGVLALIIILLLGLLWNSRRKAKKALHVVEPEKLQQSDSTLKINRFSHHGEPDAAELAGRERVELSSADAEMTHQIGEGRTRVEMPGDAQGPVEMLGDVPVGWGDMAKR